MTVAGKRWWWLEMGKDRQIGNVLEVELLRPADGGDGEGQGKRNQNDSV